jgi:hypothetical protein
MMKSIATAVALTAIGGKLLQDLVAASEEGQLPALGNVTGLIPASGFDGIAANSERERTTYRMQRGSHA